jgi:excisionase family DNA binding protein
MTAKPPTLREVRAWPAVVDVTQAAAALGISRSTGYELIRTNQFPARSIKVGGRVRVLTSSLLQVLEDDGAARPART